MIPCDVGVLKNESWLFVLSVIIINLSLAVTVIRSHGKYTRLAMHTTMTQKSVMYARVYLLRAELYRLSVDWRDVM